MQLSAAIAAFLNQRRARRRAAATIDQYRYQLEDLWMTWRANQGLPDALDAVASAELRAYLAYLGSSHINRRTGLAGLAHETQCSAWRTLRAFWHFALAQGWLPASQQDAFREAVRLPAPCLAAARRPAAPVWSALLMACTALPDAEERARNRAVLRLLEAGLRPVQVAALRDDLVDLRERRAQLQRTDGRAVVVQWGYHAAVALRAYLRVRSGAAGGALLRGCGGAARPLTAGAVRRIVCRMAGWSGTAPPGD